MQPISNYIKLGWYLFFRDFQYRYRLTFFGYLWAIIKPLLIGLPIIMIGRHFNLAGGKMPETNYEVYAFSGLIFFRIFFDAIEYPQIVMWRMRKILKEVVIPYNAVIIAGCFYGLVNLCVYLLLLIIAVNIFHISLHLSILLIIIALPLLILSGLSLGIMFAPIALFYLDIRYSLGIVSGLLVWSTPIFYVVQTNGLVGLVNKWNPLTYLINVPRNWLFGQPAYDIPAFLTSLGFFLFIFLISIKFYRKVMPIAVERAI